MSKQSIYVRHKDEIVKKLINCHKNTSTLAQSKDKVLKKYGSFNNKGWIQALEWVLGLDKTQEEKVKVDMVNKVNKKQIDDAFDYFMDTGRLDELNYDDVYYIKVLLKVVANKYNWQLIFEGENKNNDKTK